MELWWCLYQFTVCVIHTALRRRKGCMYVGATLCVIENEQTVAREGTYNSKNCLFTVNELRLLVKCLKCEVDRYWQDLRGSTTPEKVLRHFPIVPCIQKIFLCGNLVKLMSWHSLHGSEDGIMWVSIDSKAWKHIDKTWPTFAVEPQNLYLGIAMDDVNPFGVRSISWSTWLIVLVN